MSEREDVVAEDRCFLKNSLTACLKRLDESKIDELVQSMLDDGINKDSVEFVEAANLELLGFDKYQAKAVIQHWEKSKGAEGTVDPLQARQTNTFNLDPQPGTSRSFQENPAGKSFIDVSNFQLNWDLIYRQTYKGIKAGDIIKNKGCFEPKHRANVAHEIIRQAIDANVSNLSRDTIEKIYYGPVLRKHEDAFKTELASGEKSSGGFLHVLKYCFDNQKRPDRNRHLQPQDFLTKQYEQPRGKFSYCCVRWRAKDDIPDQTPETVKEQQEKMKKEFVETRPKFWDWTKLSDMIKNCYKAQREMINKNISDALQEQKKQLAQKRKRSSKETERRNEEAEDEVGLEPAVTISQVADEWPFLFSYHGMLIHFEILTGVELEKELQTCKQSLKWEVLLDFFKTTKDDDGFYSEVCRKLEKHKQKKPDGDDEFRAIILMITKYFNESSFVEIVEETVTLEVLNSTHTAPQYPSLTAPGKDGCIFKAKKFFLGVDSEFHYSFPNFERAACCVFMMYFVFNLDYAPESQISLEFLQRYIFGMDPPQGNKRPVRERHQKTKIRYSTKVVHDDVARLISKLKVLRNQKEKENNPTQSEESSSASSQEPETD
ncbi:uncharacterized protein LOC117652516 [Thrips palmi]|uniref:Uncharacterized protein LOC117652516 n=1 Tax=Thrips palmi TaxID=161013 RepID=A0A6P9A5Z1_THRPL|nr:uncharacterized protein LOC117652516 [Thrips palmi]